MKITQTISKFLLLIVVAVGFSSCGYNQMVGMEEEVVAQWANVETAYQRRSDLIPNLVETVKGYAEFEQETLEKVVQARADATSVQVDPGSMTPEQFQEFQAAQNEVSSSLGKLLVVVENYPNLKANTNFLDLQSQLEGTENRISIERMKYNETVKNYNTYIRQFPRVIYAGWFGFDKKEVFQSAEGTDVAPTVEF